MVTIFLCLLALIWLSLQDLASYAVPKLFTGSFFSHDSPNSKLDGRVGVLLASHSHFHTIQPLPSLKITSIESRHQEYITLKLLASVICQSQGQSQSFLEEFSQFAVTLSHLLLPYSWQCQCSHGSFFQHPGFSVPSLPLSHPLSCLSLPEPNSRTSIITNN